MADLSKELNKELSKDFAYCEDTISRQAAIEAIHNLYAIHGSEGSWIDQKDAFKALNSLPSVQPELAQDLPNACTDAISRQAAIDAVKKNTFRLTFAEEQNCEGHVAWSAEAVYSDVMEGALLELPSAQPERTCVNCDRTANNGGWYADGRTRCPIEEHYALPKDGYCHLWEKRNVTVDDYPERRTDE